MVLNIEILNFQSMVLDEAASFLDVIAHQDTKQSVSLTGIVNQHSEQYTSLGVHCRLPQLLRVHLTETFEASYFYALSTHLPNRRANLAQ
jgi:hypothetical protein